MSSITLDEDVRFSELPFWQHQRQYYEDSGPKAWTGEIPFYATNNPFLADQYAQLYIRAFQAGQAPEYCLELGAGSGQFAYLFLQAVKQRSEACGINNLCLRYILTDCVYKNIASWMDSKQFQPFVELGWIDFAYFDAESDEEIRLKLSGAVLRGADALSAWVVSSYLFDSLPADLYGYQDGNCYEVKARMGENASICYASSDTAVQSNSLRVQKILDDYASRFSDTKLLFPTTVIALMDKINRIFSSGVCWLVADKAYTDVSQMDFLGDPEVTPHSGAFSVQVDFVALSQYAQLSGGRAAIQPGSAGIQLGLFAFGAGAEIFSTCRSEIENLLCGTTVSDYLHLYRHQLATLSGASLEAVVSYLSFSRWDAVFFKQAFTRIQELMDGSDVLTVNYLLAHCGCIANNFYFMPGCHDIFFDIGVLFHMLKRYAEAKKYYHLSEQWFAPSYGVLFNISVCAEHLNNSEEAERYRKKAEAGIQDLGI